VSLRSFIGRALREQSVRPLPPGARSVGVNKPAIGEDGVTVCKKCHARGSIMPVTGLGKNIRVQCTACGKMYTTS
jgi:hypothetical protein